MADDSSHIEDKSGIDGAGALERKAKCDYSTARYREFV